jgi:hypothetical protein
MSAVILASNVSAVEALNAAISAADNAAAGSGAYAIELAAGADIALTSALKLISLASGVTLDIVGAGATIDGENETTKASFDQRGLFVYSGAVTIADLTIANTKAIGGAGASGGGGGAGLGGGLFVASGGNVALNDVSFSADSATGGKGGVGFTGGGGGGGLGGKGGAGARVATSTPATNNAGGGGGGIGSVGVGGAGAAIGGGDDGGVGAAGGAGLIDKAAGAGAGGSGGVASTEGIAAGGQGGPSGGGGGGGGGGNFFTKGFGGGGHGGAGGGGGGGGVGGAAGGAGQAPLSSGAGGGGVGGAGGFGGGGGGATSAAGGAAGFGAGAGGKAIGGSEGITPLDAGGGGLAAGGDISLGPSDTIVLSYLNSCVREVISGGTFRVGVEQSEARSAHIDRTKVECEAAKMLNAGGQSLDAAGLVFRDGSHDSHAPTRIAPTPDPAFTLYGASPIIELDGGGTPVVARLDQTGEHYVMAIEPGKLERGLYLDFAKDGKALTAGGVYGARWRRRLIVFRVAESAKPGDTPIVGRLMRLGFSR